MTGKTAGPLISGWLLQRYGATCNYPQQLCSYSVLRLMLLDCGFVRMLESSQAVRRGHESEPV